MDAYKKIVRRRLVLSIFSAIITLTFSVYIFSFYGSGPENDARSIGEGFLAGLPCGICVGLFAVCVFIAFRCLAMLRDEKKMRLGYNRENDERMNLIRTKAGYPFSIVAGVAMIIAGLLLARVNLTISITAIVCACGQLVVSAVLKTVYSKIL